MKKIISLFMCLLTVAFMLTGCADSKTNTQNSNLSVVTTIFPEYDWVREILGESAQNTDLTMLMDSGVDLHNYQPTAQDIIKISNCDMFIYVGGESDEWVSNVLKEATNENMVVINLLDELGNSVKEEETVEGMQEEEHESEEEHDEYDEHVWLSLKNAQLFCKIISQKLSEISPENKETYLANADSYIKKLSALDSEYQKAVESANNKTLLFGDRFAFRYLVDDYGLKYYAAFSGCSAETEASFETITFLANKADELGLSCILTLEGSDSKIARTIISNTSSKDQTVLSMNSLQSTTMTDVKNGTTYLSVMEKNLEVLKDALK